MSWTTSCTSVDIVTSWILMRIPVFSLQSTLQIHTMLFSIFSLQSTLVMDNLLYFCGHCHLMDINECSSLQSSVYPWGTYPTWQWHVQSSVFSLPFMYTPYMAMSCSVFSLQSTLEVDTLPMHVIFCLQSTLLIWILIIIINMHYGSCKNLQSSVFSLPLDKTSFYFCLYTLSFYNYSESQSSVFSLTMENISHFFSDLLPPHIYPF